MRSCCSRSLPPAPRLPPLSLRRLQADASFSRSPPPASRAPPKSRRRAEPARPRPTTTSTRSPGCRPRSSSAARPARPSTARAAAARQGAQGRRTGTRWCRPSAATPATGLPPAVIVDVDETVLDNSPYQARLVRDGKELRRRQLGRVGRREEGAGRCRARSSSPRPRRRGASPSLHLQPRRAPKARRPSTTCKASASRSRTTACSSAWAPSSKAASRTAREKNCRRQLVGRTYRVLMQFGDQLGDFVADRRQHADRSRAGCCARTADWFGERWFDAAQPDLRQLGAGAVQQRLEPAGGGAPPRQAGIA